jgi:hypothetical protein
MVVHGFGLIIFGEPISLIVTGILLMPPPLNISEHQALKTEMPMCFDPSIPALTAKSYTNKSHRHRHNTKSTRSIAAPILRRTWRAFVLLGGARRERGASARRRGSLPIYSRQKR